MFLIFLRLEKCYTIIWDFIYIVLSPMSTSTCMHCTIFFRYVVLIFNEMKIWEDLVYDRTGCHLHGFVNLGDINNQLQQLEQNVQNDSPHEHLATEMLTLMIRGLFIKLEFPYASFPTQGIAYIYM